MREYIISFLLIILVTGCKTISNDTENISKGTYPEAIDSCTTAMINQLNREAPKTGCFTIVGYVYKKYECPPCPIGVQCKPCAPEHIFVQSRMARKPKNSVLTNDDIVITVKNSRRFKIGKQYKLSFDISEGKTLHFNMQRDGANPLNDLILKGFALIE